MNLQYRILFQCEVRHQYYPTPDFDASFGPSDDFIIVPTPETQQKLRNYQLLFRPTPYGFRVMFQERLNSNGDASYIVDPKLDIPLDTRFDFEMRLKNSLFPNFTDLGSGGLTNRIRRFDNGGAPGSGPLTFEDLALSPRIFTYRPTFGILTPPSILLNVTDPNGGVVAAGETVNRDLNSGEYEYPIEQETGPDGRYIFTSAFTPGGPKTDYIYLDNHLFKQQPLGLISIFKNSDFLFPLDMTTYSPPAYTTNFESRKHRWRYIIAAKETETFTMGIPILTSPMTPNSRWFPTPVYGTVTFTGAATPVTDPEYKNLAPHVYALDSDQLDIPTYLEANPKLELSNTDGPIKMTIPSPSIKTPGKQDLVSKYKEIILYV